MRFGRSKVRKIHQGQNPAAVRKLKRLAARALTAIEEDPEQALADVEKIFTFIKENPKDTQRALRNTLIRELAKGLRPKL